MLALLSPAKTLDYTAPLPRTDMTMPVFVDQAGVTARGAARLGAAKLAALMHISDSLATLNARRFREFADAPERPALFAFAGDVYRGFDARSLEAEAVDFAQDHVRILSGLYGLLRPLDAMRPYRLEMGTRWAPGRAKDLYALWGDRVATQVALDAAAVDTEVVLNLASQEYWKVTDGRLPAHLRVITMDFREDGPDGPRFVSFNAKVTRGLMARWMCEHRITEPEAMKSFDLDGYRFAADDSSADVWRFQRAARAKAA